MMQEGVKLRLLQPVYLLSIRTQRWISGMCTSYVRTVMLLLFICDVSIIHLWCYYYLYVILVLFICDIICDFSIIHLWCYYYLYVILVLFICDIIFIHMWCYYYLYVILVLFICDVIKIFGGRPLYSSTLVYYALISSLHFPLPLISFPSLPLLYSLLFLPLYLHIWPLLSAFHISI